MIHNITATCPGCMSSYVLHEGQYEIEFETEDCPHCEGHIICVLLFDCAGCDSEAVIVLATLGEDADEEDEGE